MINGPFIRVVSNFRGHRGAPPDARWQRCLGMKDDTSEARAHRATVQSGLVVVVFGAVTLATLVYYVVSVASVPDTRNALFLRSAYEDTASEVVRQYRVALKRQNKEELCVFAGMIASAYWTANDDRTALSWKGQEHADCAAAGLPSYWGDIAVQR